MKLKLFTMVWGKKHLDLFKKTSFTSLHWPRNLEPIRGSDWYVYTKPDDLDNLVAMFKGSQFNLIPVVLGDTMDILGIGTVKTQNLADNFILLRGLIHQIQLSFEKKERMLFAPPDTIFGNGSVPNLISAGRQPGSAVVVPHMRVNPEILSRIGYPTTNQRLVELSMDHMHKCWIRSEAGHPEQATFKTGVIWKRLDEGLIEVKHQLPTTYLVDFTGDDWAYWSGTSSFGSYDHDWPGTNFIRQERQKYIGSSDACFIAEVTDKDMNQGEVTPKEILNQVSEEAYFNWRLHNSVNRQIITYFRTN